MGTWMLDTGASYGVMDTRLARSVLQRIIESQTSKWVTTASGKLNLNEYLDTKIPSLNETVRVHVYEGAPSILSVGKMCRMLGCRLTWEPWASEPQFWRTDG